MPKRCPLCNAEVVQARGRGHAPLPEPGLPLARPGDAVPLGRPRARHRERRQRTRSRSSGTRASSARSPISTGSPPSSWRRSRGTRRSRPRARSSRSSVRRSSRSGASSSASTSRRSAGSSRATSRSHFGSAEALAAATLGDLEEVEGIGPDRAVLIAEWFADEENLALDRGAARARRPDGRREGGARRRGGPADRAAVRHHGHARGLQARGGEGRARGARRQGLGLRLEEDARV